MPSCFSSYLPRLKFHPKHRPQNNGNFYLSWKYCNIKLIESELSFLHVLIYNTGNDAIENECNFADIWVSESQNFLLLSIQYQNCSVNYFVWEENGSLF